MADVIVKAKSTPRLQHLKETSAKPDSKFVRFYRESPEGFLLQIWRGKSVMSISLRDAEAVELFIGMANELDLYMSLKDIDRVQEILTR